MAKNAATEAALGALHAKLATVFEKVLLRYEANLDKLNAEPTGDLEDEIAEAITEDILEDLMPNPAMLNAVASFLKNNDIRFNDGQIEKISALKQSLEERRKRRGNVVELKNVKAVGE